MEHDLQVKPVGIKMKKRQTSTMSKMGGFQKSSTKNVPANMSKNNPVENVRKSTTVEKTKTESISLPNKNDIKKRVLSTTSKIKATHIKNEKTIPKKENKTASSLKKYTEYEKSRIVEKKHIAEDKSKPINNMVDVYDVTEHKKNNLKNVKLLEKNRTEKNTDIKIGIRNRKNNILDKDDKFLKEILKKDHISVQTEKHEELQNTKNNEHIEEPSSENSSEEDTYSLDLIEQYKKKKKKEIEKKKSEELLKRKAQLIKKVVLQDAETQVVLDDFTIFYERVKPAVDKIVEDILNRALKEILEEEELKKITNKIHIYETIRMKKLESVKTHEEKTKNFYSEVQQKIKERSELKNKVQTIIEKRIAHIKARNTLRHIFQKNVDANSMKEKSVFNDFEKSITMFIFPWMSEFIQYMMNVNTNITQRTVNEMIEKLVVMQNTKNCCQLKRLLLKEKEEQTKNLSPSKEKCSFQKYVV